MFMPGPDPAREQAEQAAAEAAAIGGSPTSDPTEAEREPARRPLVEAGEGEAEGFELAEDELVEKASHGDQHAARRAIEDSSDQQDARAAESGEADFERSSERSEDTP